MKKLFCFLAVASTAAFTSCSSDDDSVTNPPVDQVTGITLTSNTATGLVGDAFTFTVKNNLNEDVTSASTIFVNDVEIDGSTYTATAEGTYTVHATNGDFTSDDVTLTVTEEVIEITSLVVTYDNQVVSLGESITFTATANESLDVTSGTVFSVNGEAIEGNVFTATVSGAYEVTATYEGVSTEEGVVVAAIGSVDFTEANVSNTALLYYGTDTSGAYDYWRVLAYDSEIPFDQLTDENFPTTYALYDIVVPVTEGTITLPDADTAIFNTVTEVVVDGVMYPIVAVDFENATFEFTSDLSDEMATTITYSVQTGFNDTVAPSTLNINYNGAYSGWFDLSGEGRSAMNSVFNKLNKTNSVESFLNK